MPKLIFARAINIDPATREFTSYWPEHWPVEALAKELTGMATPYFLASYQNDATALAGNVLKVEWVTPYLPEELAVARDKYKLDWGVKYAGVDPGNGGSGSDPDYCAGIMLERIGNMGFLTDFLFDRLTLEDQGQRIEDWLTMHMPQYATIEDMASKGYVYTALTTQVNNKRGSIHPIHIEKPQGFNAVGGKRAKFLSMAPRFQNRQIRVPGIPDGEGGIVIDPRWEPFMNQWRSYPTGHDDLLDAAYWAAITAFRDEPGIGIALAPGVRQGAAGTNPAIFDQAGMDSTAVCMYPEHRGYLQPVVHCLPCTAKALNAAAERGDGLDTYLPGEYAPRRGPRVGVGLRDVRSRSW